MANRIYINILGSDIKISAPCSEDIPITVASQMSSFGELVPEMATITGLVSTGFSMFEGKIQGGMVNLQNALDIPRWQKTDPVKIPVDINLFIKTDPLEDVWHPAMALLAMHILSKDGDRYITPGLNLASMSKIQSSGTEATNTVSTGPGAGSNPYVDPKDATPENVKFPAAAKLCAVYIPGIVYLPLLYNN